MPTLAQRGRKRNFNFSSTRRTSIIDHIDLGNCDPESQHGTILPIVDDAQECACMKC